jgi:hypothetical protein
MTGHNWYKHCNVTQSAQIDISLIRSDAHNTLHSLERVIISSNLIQNIIPMGDGQAFVQLRHLSLTDNNLKSWADIDHLHPWCPALESLSLSGNPIVEGDGHLRARIINTVINATRDGAFC